MTFYTEKDEGYDSEIFGLGAIELEKEISND